MAAVKLVLLPGLDGTGVLFRPLLKALPPDITPIIVSYPGDQALGYSELLPFVLTALPQDAPFVLLGESFGGPLALLVAASRPAGLQAVILCATFVSCPYRFIPGWTARLVHPLMFHVFPQFSRLKARLARISNPELQALLTEALSRVSAHVLAHRIREVIQVNVTTELEKISLPILYIQGERDFIVPGWNLRLILDLKPSVQLARIPAPHMVLQTQPAMAAGTIAGFVREHANQPRKSDTPNF
jgi:pimeloyl-[acyl-carrier protein] methyl ester esterase